MKAVMLVGGLGTRLRPLTLETKKELMPVANRPFLEHVLANLARGGVTEVILTTGYLAEAFEGFPAERTHGIELTLVKEEEPLDTCGAVKNVEHLIDGTFLVCNGDILTDLDVAALVTYHREREALGTLTLAKVDDPSAYGLVPIDEDGRIERFVEKPRADEIVTNLINAGTYVLEPHILDFVPTGERYSFERGLFPLMLAEGEAMYGHVSDAYWLDIGTPAKYLRANRDTLDRTIVIDPPGTATGDRCWLGSRADIDASAKIIGAAAVGDRTQVGRSTKVGPLTAVGDDCVIGDRVTIDESVVHDGVTLGDDVTITGSVIASGATIGSGTQVSDALIGPGVKVGADNELRAGLRLWPGIDVPDAVIRFS